MLGRVRLAAAALGAVWAVGCPPSGGDGGHDDDDSAAPDDDDTGTHDDDSSEGPDEWEYVPDDEDGLPEECGDGRWGEGEPDGFTLFVDDDAVVGGDGSEGRPLRTLAEAIAAVDAGAWTTIRIAAGTYSGRLEIGPLTHWLSLVGRCAAGVVLDGSLGVTTSPVVSLETGEPVQLHRLTLAGGSGGGLAATGGETVVEDVVIAGNDGPGVVVEDGALSMARVVITDCVGAGVRTVDTLVDLDEVSVTGVRAFEDGSGGHGIVAGPGTNLTGRGVWIEGCREAGLLATGSGGVTLEYSTVTGTLPGARSGLAAGVMVQNDAIVILRESEVLEPGGLGGLAVDGGDLQLDTGSIVAAGGPVAGAVDGTLHLYGASAEALAGGLGVFAVGREREPVLYVEGSSVAGATRAAVYLEGPGSYLLRECDLEGGPAALDGGTWPQGNAVFATTTAAGTPLGPWEGEDGPGLKVESCSLHDAQGGAIFLDGAGAAVETDTFAGNTWDLVVQRCAVAPAGTGYETAPIREECPVFDHRVVPPLIDFRAVEVGF